MSERTGKRRPGRRRQLRPSLHGILSAISAAPAIIRNEHLDLIAANPLAQALYEPILASAKYPNLARFVFLDEDAAQNFFPDWERLCDECAHILRRAVQHDPHDKTLHRLIGELSTRSPTFRHRWSALRGCGARASSERVSHPIVGKLDLIREELGVPLDPDVTVTVYLPSDDEATVERLAILASWSQPEPGEEINNHYSRKEDSK